MPENGVPKMRENICENETKKNGDTNHREVSRRKSVIDGGRTNTK